MQHQDPGEKAVAQPVENENGQEETAAAGYNEDVRDFDDEM